VAALESSRELPAVEVEMAPSKRPTLPRGDDTDADITVIMGEVISSVIIKLRAFMKDLKDVVR